MMNPLALNSRFYGVALITALLFLTLVFEPFYNAILIWLTNDIYNHCALVLPASAYLIWEKRKQIDLSTVKPSWLAFIALVLQLILYTLGTASDIQLFQHAALFAMIPTFIWLFLGDRIAWQLQFPLAFMLFAIPVGEELIPFLQEITADMSVEMLAASGVPLFRSGLFIEIPGGKFLVAEACSGVSFLIASIVVGNLYGYMNLNTWRYRILFVVISVLLPILANAVRVYGIIMIAHKTNMEHAVGADHLIYGWFFFAFVLICLLVIGEVVKRFDNKHTSSEAQSNAVDAPKLLNPRVRFTPLFSILLILVLALYQDSRMQSFTVISSSNAQLTLGFSKLPSSPGEAYDEDMGNSLIRWQPVFPDAMTASLNYYESAGRTLQIFSALYSPEKGEVVSSLNRLYQQERWTLVEREVLDVDGVSITKELVAGPSGQQKLIYYWYVVNADVLRTAKDVKLIQAIQRLGGSNPYSGLVAVGVDIENTQQIAQMSASIMNELSQVVSRSQQVFSGG
ncbi:exosortase A [Ningiella sp. W23]|uniref:exosortase A n=1 Tax=Ningiella sp. W23 TaxID=3023715 RepID=UPI003756B0FE